MSARKIGSQRSKLEVSISAAALGFSIDGCNRWSFPRSFPKIDGCNCTHCTPLKLPLQHIRAIVRILIAWVPIYRLTLVYLIAEQAVISKQDGIFQKTVKQAGHNKQAGWNILEYLISEQAEFHKKSHF